MAQPRGTVSIATDRCKGCGLCTIACPVKIIAFRENHPNSKGYQPVTITDPSLCTGCGNCALMCPDSVLSGQRFTRKRRVAHA